MKRVLFAFLLLIYYNGQQNASAQSVLPDSINDKLTEIIEGIKLEYNLPSIVIAIVNNNDILYHNSLGYADLNKKTKATIDTKYPIASITKSFSATMLMHQMERDIVNLSDDVKKYVPEYTVKSDFYGNHPTTLLQLATHSSGLPRNSPADFQYTYYSDRWILSKGAERMKWQSTKEDFLHSLQFISLEYPPYHKDGFLPHYSNLGYVVLGLALERASHVEFTKFIKDSICYPLKMFNTGFLNEAEIRNEIASGYSYLEKDAEPVKTPLFEPNSALYSGGMYSTASDLSKYIPFLYQENILDSHKVISPDSKAMMKNFNVGLGFEFYPEYPMIQFGGAILGYQSNIVFSQDLKLGWVILTNSYNHVDAINFQKINSQIRDLLIPIVNNNCKKEHNDNKAKYIGTYKLPGDYSSIDITKKGEKLYSSYLHNILLNQELSPNGINRFICDGPDEFDIGYEFIENNDGEIEKLLLGGCIWIKEQ